jgi:hypothetical protein
MVNWEGGGWKRLWIEFSWSDWVKYENLTGLRAGNGEAIRMRSFSNNPNLRFSLTVRHQVS